MTHREADSAPSFELIMSGVDLRVFLTAPDGRTLDSVPGSAHADAADSRVRAFRTTAATSPAPCSPSCAAHVDQALSPRFPAAHSRRFANGGLRHLLDLASQGMFARGELHVLVSQRELADAIGTVREVVVRVLREFRAEELIRTERDRIVMVKPVQLARARGWSPKSPDSGHGIRR